MEDDTIARLSEGRGLNASDLRQAASSALGGVLWLGFAYMNISGSIRSGRVIGLGLGLLQLLTAAIYFARRPADRVSGRPADWLVAFAGTFGVLLCRPGGPFFPWADPVGHGLQGCGLLLLILSLGALGRSFGIVPADRGIVTSGPYRVVRHPMYAAYALGQIGYLIQSPRVWNVCVLAVVWACQALRIVNEERFLSTDAQYRGLLERTRWRLVPGLW